MRKGTSNTITQAAQKTAPLVRRTLATNKKAPPERGVRKDEKLLSYI